MEGKKSSYGRVKIQLWKGKNPVMEGKQLPVAISDSDGFFGGGCFFSGGTNPWGIFSEKF